MKWSLIKRPFSLIKVGFGVVDSENQVGIFESGLKMERFVPKGLPWKRRSRKMSSEELLENSEERKGQRTGRKVQEKGWDMLRNREK